MGTGRGKNAQRSDKKRNHPNVPASASLSAVPTKPAQPRPPARYHLRDLVPKAGISYPFQEFLMKRVRTEVEVTAALKQGAGDICLTGSAIDGLLAGTFTDVVEALLEDETGTFKDNFISFIEAFRWRWNSATATPTTVIWSERFNGCAAGFKSSWRPITSTSTLMF